MSLATPDRIRSLQRKLYRKAKADGSFAVCPTVKPVGKPDAGNRHVRFDERGRETGRCRMAQATAPFLDSTNKSAAEPGHFGANVCGITGHPGRGRSVENLQRRPCNPMF